MPAKKGYGKKSLKGRIVKKQMAVSHPYDIRTRYVVDGIFIFPTLEEAKEFAMWRK